MVLQNQIDFLEFLTGSNNINNSILTSEGEVSSFPLLSRNLMEPDTLEVDFLDDSTLSMSHEETIATVEEDYQTTFSEDDESPLYKDAFTFQFHKVPEELTRHSQSTSTSSVSDVLDIDEVTSTIILQEVDQTCELPLTPLLKEGIKYKIQNRRKAEGKEELKVEFKEPEPERLTEEEELKRQVRREKNKMAAQKCRSKKRQLAETLQRETEKLAAKQRKLQKEIDSLKTEKEHLEEIIKVHSFVCPEFTVS